jgi:hypothetical protein
LSIVNWRTVSSKRLLLLAAILHITLAVVITLVGKFGVAPHTFDSNGIGISFAIDSVSYRQEALQLTGLLREGRFRDWLNYQAPLATFHARIYSISYLVFGKILGEGVLGVEPVNLVYYLSTLGLLYLIGAVTFSPSVGRMTAAVVALWPSLLVLSTQLLRDQFFIAVFLLLLLALIVCIKEPLSYKRAIGWAAIAVATLIMVPFLRPTMWEVVIATVFIGAAASIIRQLTTRQFDMPGTLAVLLICLTVFALPRMMNVRSVTEGASRTMATRKSAPSINGLGPWSRVARQVGWARQRFINSYATAGSNLDADVEIQTFRDLVRYLPRAVEVGLLAPFPRMWFIRGVHVGLTGRIVVGAEMLVLYLLMLFACLTLIYERKRALVWFLFAVTVLGSVVLAYVVVNAAVLYRLRYPYFIPIVLLGVQGLYVRGLNGRGGWSKVRKQSIQDQPEVS